MNVQKMYRRFEEIMAAVAFAEAGEHDQAKRMAFREAEKPIQKEQRTEAQPDNRPVLRC